MYNYNRLLMPPELYPPKVSEPSREFILYSVILNLCLKLEESSMGAFGVTSLPSTNKASTSEYRNKQTLASSYEATAIQGEHIIVSLLMNLIENF